MIRSRRPKIVKKNCPFCKEKTEPTYKDLEGLKKFLTERGKIVGRARTGICSKHQKRIALSIKHARHLALLPFIVRPY